MRLQATGTLGRFCSCKFCANGNRVSRRVLFREVGGVLVPRVVLGVLFGDLLLQLGVLCFFAREQIIPSVAQDLGCVLVQVLRGEILQEAQCLYLFFG